MFIEYLLGSKYLTCIITFNLFIRILWKRCNSYSHFTAEEVEDTPLWESNPGCKISLFLSKIHVMVALLFRKRVLGDFSLQFIVEHCWRAIQLWTEWLQDKDGEKRTGGSASSLGQWTLYAGHRMGLQWLWSQCLLNEAQPEPYPQAICISMCIYIDYLLLNLTKGSSFH